MVFVAVVVAWQLAGFTDWLLHRHARIDVTAGSRESLLHLVMAGEMGAVLLAFLWLPATCAVLGVCLALLLLHELTVYVDLRWAVPRRHVGPLEQLVHSAQELLPLVALVWWATASPASSGGTVLATALPLGFVVAAHAGGALLLVLYLEELQRCCRAERRSAHVPAAVQPGDR